jgi:hypothetical protein
MTPALAAMPSRNLVYLEHCAPSGHIKVRLSGQDKFLWATQGREQALRLARLLGGDNAVIFESIGPRRKPR